MWNLEHSVVCQLLWLGSSCIWRRLLEAKKNLRISVKQKSRSCFGKHILIWRMLQFVGVLHSCTANSISHATQLYKQWVVQAVYMTHCKLPNKYPPFALMYFLSLKDFVILYRPQVDVESPLGSPEESNSKERKMGWLSLLVNSRAGSRMWSCDLRPHVLGILSLI